jgi:hypothetical protein
MSDFREHARNHLRTAAGTYKWADHTQAAPSLGALKNISLNGYRSQHVIGVEVECAAPELGLEHMTHLLADGVFTGLDQQSRPFERPQHAR